MQHRSAQKCTRSKLKVMPLSLYVVYTRTFIFQLVGSLKASDFFYVRAVWAYYWTSFRAVLAVISPATYTDQHTA